MSSMYETAAAEWISVESPEAQTILADCTVEEPDHRFDWLGRYDNHLEDWISKPAQVELPF
jgi:hypothetical protein